MGHLKTILLWLPRVSALMLALLLAMLTTAGVMEAEDFWASTRGFIPHLVPSLCVIAILIVGWRRDGLASIGFFLLAIAFFVAFSGWKRIPEALSLSLPPLGISLAFFARMRLLKGREEE